MDSEFKPKYEETETAIKTRVLSHIDGKWRKEPGDFMYDAATPAAPEIKQLQANQDNILKNAFALHAEGVYLDYKAAEANVLRNPAMKAKGNLIIAASAGTKLEKGHELLSVVLDKDKNPITATIDATIEYLAEGPQPVAITTTGTGLIMNVPAGSEWVLSPSVPGVRSITQEQDLDEGKDHEGDDSLRARWIEQRSKNRRSGNKQDYIAWATEITGVGAAKCIPLWNGRGTVKVIIVDIYKQPATAELVAAVQLYIDPDQTGEGNGQAPVGAVVTVESATALLIDVTATLELAGGATLEAATDRFKKDLDDYLAKLSFDESTEIVYTKVAGLLSTNPYIDDYLDFTVNGGAVNIPVDVNEVPGRGTVTFN